MKKVLEDISKNLQKVLEELEYINEEEQEEVGELLSVMKKEDLEIVEECDL